VASARHAYPRPQLVRKDWASLDGPWRFSLDPEARLRSPEAVPFDRQIEIPFAPETELSGVAERGFFSACWYQRTFEPPPLQPDERLILHFGAVDHAATVWVDGVVGVRHEGGYTPFSLDITDLVHRPQCVLTVRAHDDPADLAKPRGKQDWQLEPHAIWYPRTTGIWQSVWMERVPGVRIDSLRWTCDLERWEIGLSATVAGAIPRETRLRVRLRVRGVTLADDHYGVLGNEVTRRIALADPGIDDYRNELLWSPTNPTLIGADLELVGPGGALDTVRSYTALRSAAVQGERFLLNGRVMPLRLVLDQGYWPGGGLTAPDDRALQQDVLLAKAMGFNGCRKHQKIECPRFLYWADRLGFMVWEEMPSAYRFTQESISRLTTEWTAVLARDHSHPSIVAWVPFNESWGVPDLPAIEAQRHYVQALYHLTKTLDPSRPVIGNDGWESVATDIVGIHDYDGNPERLARRYEHLDTVPQLFKHGRPGGRLLTVEGHPFTGQPVMLTEFGGVMFGEDAKVWGYGRAETAAEFAEHYRQLLEAVRGSELLSGFCYTQFADTYQEANGLLRADRTPKIPLDEIAAATRGPQAVLAASPQQALAADDTDDLLGDTNRP
jgi:beta-galactosidase/beta-glucuronidase